jgi:hypothetical protein
VRLTALLLSLLAVLVAAQPALGQGRNAPPGNSSVDEYTESLPGPDGDRAVPRDGDPLPPRSGDPAPGDVGGGSAAGLGRDGRAAALLAARTGPKRALDGSPGAGHATVEGRSTFAQIVDALGGSGAGGMGALLPLLLLAAVVAAVAAALRRRATTAT